MDKDFPEEKNKGEYVEGLIFPREEWDALIKWEPVSNLDPYEDAPQAVRDYHNNYVKVWLGKGDKNGR
jgi:hypothetical protein